MTTANKIIGCTKCAYSITNVNSCAMSNVATFADPALGVVSGIVCNTGYVKPANT